MAEEKFTIEVGDIVEFTGSESYGPGHQGRGKVTQTTKNNCKVQVGTASFKVKMENCEILSKAV